MMQAVGQSHVTVAMMVTEGFTVSSNMNELTGFTVIGKTLQEPGSKILSAVQKPMVGYVVRSASIVEKQGNALA